MKKRIIVLALVAGAVLSATSCTGQKEKTAGLEAPGDYAVSANWLGLPAYPDKAADVFFLYPTCFFGAGDSCALDDEGMRAEARKIKEAHIGIFDAANFFAPYYRQLSIPYIASLGAIDKAEVAVGAIPLVDCKNAFEYYLEHYNAGRPVVFAGHSQGTIIMRQLLLWLKEAHPEVLQRTVAAYMIGFTINQEYVERVGLPFATGAADTGVIVSYNSESPDATINPFITAMPGALAINPINWKRDETHAGKEESLGSKIRFGDAAPVDRPHFADAQVNARRGSVATNAALEAGPPWPAGVLHRYDYDIFYYDLQKNVGDRIAAYTHPLL
ncbi:MAG: DUF3089 domain-containing protein [Spirochaetaceae bacterium]|jgi:hypothetical protein|nr:DUF3089 domain-containing protein [Spirochaetaceae bacterium]